MNFDLYTSVGTKQGSVAASDEIFKNDVNETLMHEFVVMQLANKRVPVAHTLTRGEVNKTTKKAFRQKGTGRARRGALSTNLVRGGGVTHGPRNVRNFSKSMPKKSRRKALFSSFSLQAQKKNIFSLESFVAKTPKTKDFVSLAKKLPEAKKYLFILPKKDPVFEKSTSNVPNIRVIKALYSNPYDILWADKVCIFKEAFPIIESTFSLQK